MTTLIGESIVYDNFSHYFSYMSKINIGLEDISKGGRGEDPEIPPNSLIQSIK